MSDVKRYRMYGLDCVGYGKCEHDEGEWVKAADYDALLAKFDQAWKSASSESHAWAREYEARMLVVAERDQLRAELEAIRGQQGALYVSAESLADDGVVGMHATRKPNAVQNVALYALPPQQPDAVSVPRALLESLLRAEAESLHGQYEVAMDELRALLTTKTDGVV
ncbi:hypothetical protein GO594_25655 [Pseudomonas otitidis]|uniref:Uncharacterized protein n=1 Tax=Metapseudomonas otitidis TaxID=319939 RepID=A0A7X3KXQ8_9GAMM|nr:hypothetical protein [Pseudomonas otitidis]MWK59388.1 hypothetical protein [Pseudomonas otitidis]